MRSRRPRWALVALTVAVLAVWWTRHVQEGGTVPGTTDPHVIAVVTAVYGGAATAEDIDAALRSVRVVGSRPSPGGYDRDCGSGGACSFGTAWSDATDAEDGHNGCDTRNDVLREQLVGVQVDPATSGCKVSAGRLVDPYTGTVVDFAESHADIEIDHVVPLAYAWDMGASRWTQEQRELFANDTARELLASWGPANQDKSDDGPGRWLPPDGTFRCDYVLRFVQVAAHYGLAITDDDAAAVRRTARLC